MAKVEERALQDLPVSRFRFTIHYSFTMFIQSNGSLMMKMCFFTLREKVQTKPRALFPFFSMPAQALLNQMGFHKGKIRKCELRMRANSSIGD